MTSSMVLASYFLLAVGVAQATPPHIGILPIVECPDTELPQVILVPSLAGVELAANQYVVCFRGVPQVFNCTKGLFFNWSTMSCDFPYERKGQNTTSPLGDLDLLPVGPIQVPASPQHPIPFWPDRRNNYYPPQYPITKPNPEILLPAPVLPVHQLPSGAFPITKPNPEILLPIPVLPVHQFPSDSRPIPYNRNY